MTTTTSGSNDIFIISKGKILVWVPKSKINQDYAEGKQTFGGINDSHSMRLASVIIKILEIHTIRLLKIFHYLFASE